MTGFVQTPDPGQWMVRYRGDVVTFSLTVPDGAVGTAWMRTNLGCAGVRRHEIIAHVEEGIPILDRDWHDMAMQPETAERHVLRIPLSEAGCFQAKTFFLPDGEDEPVWPDGANVHVKVEPAEFCCANSLYSVFARQFRPDGTDALAADRRRTVKDLDRLGYAVIPRSGTFRDVVRRLDTIMDDMGFSIIQLLPIHPTPTTYARMGRFGSPFAAIDFMDVDPALAEFDRRTTPLDQFRELVDNVHARGGRLFLDIPVNHTGWASSLQIHHPDWFRRTPDNAFRSPGAWGVTWEDLSELDYGVRRLWRYMAEIFIFWCSQGVDGFRCDAGYMVPFEVWRYVVAKTREQFPDTVFFLEGLGGRISVTEALLGEAGLNWAYSEIFQQYDRGRLDAYLPDTFRISREKGALIHFAETHDNNRLAATSETYARMRTALSALCAEAGGFGIANGVEWFATAKIDVHGAPPLKWGNATNQVDAIRRLNAILRLHPAFAAGVPRHVVDGGNGAVFALRRGDAPGPPGVLVLANLDCEHAVTVRWSADVFAPGDEGLRDLVSGADVRVKEAEGAWTLPLAAGAVVCLVGDRQELEAVAAAEREGPACSRIADQVRRAKAYEVAVVLRGTCPDSDAPPPPDPAQLAADPEAYCRAVRGGTPCVTTWRWPRDAHRTAPVPAGDFLLVRAERAFRCQLRCGGEIIRHEHSLAATDGTAFALLMPVSTPPQPRPATLAVTVFEEGGSRRVDAPLLLLGDGEHSVVRRTFSREEIAAGRGYGLLTNARGAMVQAMASWGRMQSQYDALLAANLHPGVPIDRQVLLRRCRAWLVYRGYSQELNDECLSTFTATPGALTWSLEVPAGLGRLVPLEVRVTLNPEENATTVTLMRRAADDEQHLDDAGAIKLIIRPDIEDRSMHSATKAYAGPETAWPAAVRSFAEGFRFAPGGDHALTMRLAGGEFTSEPEWTYMVAHSFEEARGLEPTGDVFSPGYFACTLQGNESAHLLASARADDAADVSSEDADVDRTAPPTSAEAIPLLDGMREAMAAYIVRRGDLKTVIAGYPWFLDWGRDTLICLRGLIAAGYHDEAAAILRAFGGLERDGTLPNMLAGDDDTNRDTSDAPLWFAVACRDLCREIGADKVLGLDCGGRSLRDVLFSIANGYIRGTSNGIAVDAESGLVFSPAHFTWMDTQHPTGTPRQGYPIEVQALWYAALVFLAEIAEDGRASWESLGARVRASVHVRYLDPSRWFLSDCLHAESGQTAREAGADDALRCNQLLAITLGLVSDPVVGRKVLQACEELLVPGAIRSLADRPVGVPLDVRHEGQRLNDPERPYWGQYRGDEDTRRKPAYHNGTAWTWPFPSYCEALLAVYGEAVKRRCRSLLTGSVTLIDRDCAGQVPEVVDGDTPHAARGCGAQAWGVTELYRVLALLQPSSMGQKRNRRVKFQKT